MFSVSPITLSNSVSAVHRLSVNSFINYLSTYNINNLAVDNIITLFISSSNLQ